MEYLDYFRDLAKQEKEQNRFKEEFMLYPIGTEVLLTQDVDGHLEYCIDTIIEISITKEEIVYYFEEADMKVIQPKIVVYTMDKEQELKDKGYNYMRSGYTFTD